MAPEVDAQSATDILLDAANPVDGGGAYEALLWMGALLVLILLAVVGTAYIRRQFRGSKRAGESSFTLEELCRLRDRGAVTTEEFEALKQGVLEDFCGRATRDG